MAPEPAGTAWRYHQATKHTPARVRGDRFQPDWSDEPRPSKLYRQLPAVPLPPAAAPAGVPVLDAIAGTASARRLSVPDVATLATVLRSSAGIIKRLHYAGGVKEFRAASSTGALYHLELYVVCGDLPGVAAGVYHFGAPDLTLTQLRSDDWRSVLVEACADHPAAAVAPAFLVCTSTFWRNAWRYRERAFRHAFWDSGTLLANALAVANAHGVPATLLTGFVDEAVSRLLGLDAPREVATCLIALGNDAGTPPRDLDIPPLDAPAVPASRSEQRYPIVEQAYAATSLTTPAAVRDWRARALAWPASRSPRDGGTDVRVAFDPLSPEQTPQAPIEAVIERRRSARRFSDTAIDGAALAAMLDAAMRDIPADYRVEGSAPLSEPFLIVNAVRGLDPGAYIYHAAAREFELLKEGAFREHAYILALDQVRAGFAAASIYFFSDLRGLLAATGERGYRIAQLDAAIRSGRLYLGATAFGLGATALTFYDDAVVRFFSPRAAGLEAAFLVVVGQRPIP